MLDTAHRQILEKESTMAGITGSAGLFEVNIPDYKQLKQCRKEVSILKELWDMITMVDSSMKDWKTTKWREINVENMELECKHFSKDIRGLDKESRAWDAFTGLDSTVKNILTSLRAVAELQNPAIRERHWHQLMQATGVHFTMDDDTTLADLLKLNLHNFEDDVRGIVDKAVKELGMEKVLTELNTIWTGMEFQYEPHHRTQVPFAQVQWRVNWDSWGQPGAAAEPHVLQVHCFLPWGSLSLAEEVVHSWLRHLNLVWGAENMVSSGEHLYWVRGHPFSTSWGKISSTFTHEKSEHFECLFVLFLCRNVM